MAGRWDRRQFLQFSGLGLAGVSSAGLLTGCAQEEAEPEFWQVGNYPPVREETTATELKVEGSLPPELNGLYVRNGPNAWQGTGGHFFMGDGMLHGIRLENGKAQWFRSSYVKTPLLYKETNMFLSPPELDETMSNVSLIYHGDRLLSLGEQGYPYQIDPQDLGTIGAYDYAGKLPTNHTAHPKIDPVTGEMHFFGYNVMRPYLIYMRADANGDMIQVEDIETQGPAMMHDFAMSENHIIFMEMPVVFSWLKVLTGSAFPFAWDDDAPCRFGVMPKGGSSDDVKWFDVDPCFIFHTMNAYEQGDEVVMEACRYDRLWVTGSDDFNHPAYLSRYTMNLKTGKVSLERIDDQQFEFPQINRDMWGHSYQYGYGLTSHSEGGDISYEGASGIVKFNRGNGTNQLHSMDKNHLPGEVFYVPASGATAEDDGYLLTYVYDATTHTSDLWVLEAKDLTRPPVAKVKLPVRVPVGFHGVWVPS